MVTKDSTLFSLLVCHYVPDSPYSSLCDHMHNGFINPAIQLTHAGLKI